MSSRPLSGPCGHRHRRLQRALPWALSPLGPAPPWPPPLGPPCPAATSAQGAPHACWALWEEDRVLVSSEASPGTQRPRTLAQGVGSGGGIASPLPAGPLHIVQSSAPESVCHRFSRYVKPLPQALPKPWAIADPVTWAGSRAGRWDSHLGPLGSSSEPDTSWLREHSCQHRTDVGSRAEVLGGHPVALDVSKPTTCPVQLGPEQSPPETPI